MHTCAYVRMHTYAHICMHMHVYARIRMHTCVYAHSYTYAHVCTRSAVYKLCTHTYIRRRINTYSNIQVMYANTYAYALMHTFTCKLRTHTYSPIQVTHSHIRMHTNSYVYERTRTKQTNSQTRTAITTKLYIHNITYTDIVQYISPLP